METRPHRVSSSLHSSLSSPLRLREGGLGMQGPPPPRPFPKAHPRYGPVPWLTEVTEQRGSSKPAYCSRARAAIMLTACSWPRHGLLFSGGGGEEASGQVGRHSKARGAGRTHSHSTNRRETPRSAASSRPPSAPSPSTFPPVVTTQLLGLWVTSLAPTMHKISPPASQHLHGHLELNVARVTSPPPALTFPDFPAQHAARASIKFLKPKNLGFHTPPPPTPAPSQPRPSLVSLAPKQIPALPRAGQGQVPLRGLAVPLSLAAQQHACPHPFFTQGPKGPLLPHPLPRGPWYLDQAEALGGHERGLSPPWPSPTLALSCHTGCWLVACLWFWGRGCSSLRPQCRCSPSPEPPLP